MDTAASGSSPAAEPEALKHSFSYLVNSIDTAALLTAALSRNLITDRQQSGDIRRLPSASSERRL